MERRKVKVDVLIAERYDSEWPPDKLPAFAEWANRLLESVPAECRPAAEIEFDARGGYDGDCIPELSVFYWRDETDDEMQYRAAEEAQRRARQVADLEWQLKKLKGE
jgi:hypothetical protein